MLFSNPNIKTIFTHENNSTILNIFHLNFNDDDHFLFLSDDGLIKEYSIKPKGENFIEIDKCNLLRPSEEILSKNNHPILKFKNKDDYIHLTKTLIFENYIGLGYEDGLVLVYIIERQNKTNQNIEEENNENDDNDKNNNEIKKNYYNAFSLYYIFLGHPQKITSLAYYDPKKYFITASDACLVKIFSITTGYSLFHFNLDCIINNILIIENKTNTNLIFLCEEPYKLNIDITNEPFSFNHYTFRYNNINNIVKVDKKYYLLGTSNNIYVFKENFDFDNKFSTEDKIDFDYFINYGKNFIIVDGEYNLRFCELKNNDIIFSFKFKLSNDNITTGMIVYNKYFLCGSQDGNVYFVNIEEYENTAWELKKMSNEEKESNIFNEEYNAGKNKKKKKDKDGGKDKDKKKKGKKK